MFFVLISCGFLYLIFMFIYSHIFQFFCMFSAFCIYSSLCFCAFSLFFPFISSSWSWTPSSFCSFVCCLCFVFISSLCTCAHFLYFPFISSSWPCTSTSFHFIARCLNFAYISSLCTCIFPMFCINFGLVDLVTCALPWGLSGIHVSPLGHICHLIQGGMSTSLTAILSHYMTLHTTKYQFLHEPKNK
jgi:hypothetical protein